MDSTTGGTPDLEYRPEPQFANLLWDSEVTPGDPVFNREIRSAFLPGPEGWSLVAAFVEECGRRWPEGRGEVPFTTKRTATGVLVRIEPEQHDRLVVSRPADPHEEGVS